MNDIDLTISIVSFNSKDLLRRCLKSIFKYITKIKFEIIVADNGSDDGTLRMLKKEFTKVKTISNKTNLFFSKANNQILKKALGKYFLILNQDTYFTDSSLIKMLNFMEKNKDVAACEGLEIYESGTVVPTGSRFSTPLIDFFELSLIGKRIKNNKIIKNYRLSKKNRKGIFDIDVGCDAFLCVRTKIINEIKGYDEDLLLYYTENDLCSKIKKSGYRIVHFGETKIIHRVSSSADKLGREKINIYYRDLFKYYKKHNYLLSGLLLYSLLSFEKEVLKLFKKI